MKIKQWLWLESTNIFLDIYTTEIISTSTPGQTIHIKWRTYIVTNISTFYYSHDLNQATSSLAGRQLRDDQIFWWCCKYTTRKLRLNRAKNLSITPWNSLHLKVLIASLPRCSLGFLSRCCRLPSVCCVRVQTLPTYHSLGLLNSNINKFCCLHKCSLVI